MLIEITELEQLGALVRATRKASGVRQDDLGEMLHLSHVYVGGVERGSPKSNVGGIFQILQELGIHLHLDVPRDQDAVQNVLASCYTKIECK